MSRLMKKFAAGVSGILILVLLLSLYLNANVIERYFLYREKQQLNRVCDGLISGDRPLEAAVREAEASEDVVVAWVKETQDNDRLNEQLRQAFLDKGIGIKKYWLWEQDQQDAMRNGRKMRMYYQEKLHYSLLVEYLSWEGYFIAAAKIIPSVNATLALVNKAAAAVFAGAAAVMLLLILFLVRRITAPLKEIGETAREIAGLNFRRIEIHTNDELEELADDINHMSAGLEQAHRELEEKNRQMKELLANVSHDLKTPVALIKAYAGGMKEGLDDGTFLDTIIAQNERMGGMIKRLLDLAKMQQKEGPAEEVELSARLTALIKEYGLQARRRNLEFVCEIQEALTAVGDEEGVELILSNLISNAVQYAEGGVIKVTLRKNSQGCLFRIQNEISGPPIDASRLWEPFYVAEQSRNKDMSGTGLGLSMVKAAADRYGWDCGCEVKGHTITFSVQFRLETAV